MDRNIIFKRTGLIGLLITFISNVGMAFLVGIDMQKLWAVWAPLYLMWIVFYLVGMVSHQRENHRGDNSGNRA